MILFPFCKINLGLQITAKRPDGFHDLDTVFLPVKDWYDVLEILPAERDEFFLSGAPLDGDPADNLVCRARDAMRRHLAQQGRALPACSLRLHKTVPSGAGLGGGSSDATHTLIGLNQLFELGLSVSDIEALSRPLGSDCAFFSADAPARATGRGDRLERFSSAESRSQTCLDYAKARKRCFEKERLTPGADASDCLLWIIVPPVHISTAQAYAGARPQAGRPALPQLLRRPVSDWPHCIENDFEKTLFPQLPVLAEIKEKFYELGAFYASLSGSGAALFGLFREEPAAEARRAFPADCVSFRTRIAIPSVRN